MSRGKKLVCAGLIVFSVVLLGLMAGNTLALNATYNRPNPLMDYVPQEIGIYDTRYDNLTEADCRACHGDSLADRHHMTMIVLRDKLCTPCHEIISEPPGVTVIRDCTTSGCHSWNDLGPLDGKGDGPNGWHHSTNLSASENCTICHSEKIVAEITPFSSFAQYPPTVVTPTPFSCENCHWDQDLVDATPPWIPGDPTPTTANAGHPSTYDHRDAWGNWVGYYEYKKPILGNFDNLHMGFKGDISGQCYKCHANDPNDPSWDPTNSELIRYCEICHDIATLHTIYEHVGPPGTSGGPAVEGWEAIGFHTGGGGTTPSVYVGDNADGFSGKAHSKPTWGGNLTGYFEANEMCLGCHGDGLSDYYEGPLSSPPNADSMEPNAGCPGAEIVITGSKFGDEQTAGRFVQMKDGTWVTIPVYSWTDTQIVAVVPAWTFSPGLYTVRVKTEGGGNSVGIDPSVELFQVLDCPSAKVISDDSGGDDQGPCEGTITLSGGTGKFGSARDTISAPGAEEGVYRTVVIASSQGTYVAGYNPGPPADFITNHWSNTSVKFKLQTAGWFVDEDDDFLKDTGEAVQQACEDLNLGTYAVYIKYIYYKDDDASGDYSNNDTMYQVESSNLILYELTNNPSVFNANPKSGVVAKDIVKIIGANFGPTQTTGQVFTGSKSQYTSDSGKLQDNVRMWSNTKIKIKIKAPAAYAGKTKYLWVDKGGVQSNAVKLKFAL
jgi:hypothetical protein